FRKVWPNAVDRGQEACRETGCQSGTALRILKGSDKLWKALVLYNELVPPAKRKQRSDVPGAISHCRAKPLAKSRPRCANARDFN
ncbi:MAG: hypothetical protein ACKPKO_07070, partial [Candidatus Fonsibacter sp.]